MRSIILPLVVILGARAGAQQPRRAILASFDGFSEQRYREYADAADTPALHALFGGGACADAVRPAFPSVTPAGHAAIWTGAWPNVDGVSASANGKLPLQSTTILDHVDGFSALALRAEPIWIAAARQGKRVFSHMATQSPQPPAYAPVTEDTPELRQARARAAAALARPGVEVLNVYNDLVAQAHSVTSPSQLSWAFGGEGDSLHARIRDDSTVIVELNRGRRHSVLVRLAPTDTTSPRGRPLARFFSAPLRVDLRGGRRTFVYFRLWELSPDHTRLLLYASEARVVQANTPKLAREYDDAVQGVPGNGSDWLMQRGGLGPERRHGGDGSAEMRYLETSELLTRQFMRGTEWGWLTFHPALAVDYLPQPDEALHTFLGYADPGTPDVAPRVREWAARMLARTYVLVDLRLAQLQRLASSGANVRLFVTGEHGMRPTWRTFHPNVALRAAGLLAVDVSGEIDLSQTAAAAARGSWISVNRVGRRGGIVPRDSVDAVLSRAERALLAVRDSAGRPIVTHTWRAGSIAGDSLGIGGPGGGDLYYSLAPGYFPNESATGPLVTPMDFPQGEHGFASVDRDMKPAFCAFGAGVAARRFGEIRSIDISPTVSAWLGISPPADARGRVVP